jgi:glycosyltransferase involved in cell wall biosynthesis
MAHILVNGISAKSGGGRSVLTNFLTVLSSRRLSHRFTVVVPDLATYSRFSAPGRTLVPMRWRASGALLPFTTELLLPRLFRELGCDAMLNFSDLPVPGIRHQVFLFDWPYAAYPDSVAWKMGGAGAILKRRAKLWMFRRNLTSISTFVAQGPAIGKRMRILYGFDNVEIVPNAVSIDNLSALVEHDFRLPVGVKFLCLSRYYSHKNLEVFLELAERIRSAGLDWKIVITIEPSDSPGSQQLLETIGRRGLGGVVLNVGAVPMEWVPGLYRQTDALLLPTLLESFSGTYVEAMHHGKPIFTSRLDFAEDVCGEAAIYFDPLDPEDIWRTLREAIGRPEVLSRKVEAGYARLAEFPDWGEAFDSCIKLIEQDLESGI